MSRDRGVLRVRSIRLILPLRERLWITIMRPRLPDAIFDYSGDVGGDALDRNAKGHRAALSQQYRPNKFL